MQAMKTYRRPPREQVQHLLAASGLPTSDVTPEHIEHYLACGAADRPSGVVGVELHGEAALLRSLAVAAEHRGTGCGKALVAEAERYARSQGVNELYLLTTTAERFFERLGYRRAMRETAPEAIRGTQEFSALCPSTAAFMVKLLAACD
jgi:amino-acid N-acetyltransferase